VLGEVTETVYVVDDEDEEEGNGEWDGEVKTKKKQSEMLFVRGIHHTQTDYTSSRQEFGEVLMRCCNQATPWS
jgi:ribonuclease PH